MLEITERVEMLSNESFWEIKAQCLEFATVMLSSLRSHTNVLAVKEEIKTNTQGNKEA
jgi:hypothetical protein